MGWKSERELLSQKCSIINSEDCERSQKSDLEFHSILEKKLDASLKQVM